RFVQGRELRRKSDQGIDEKNLLELIGPVAARDQQMTNLVVRIEQYHAHRVERIGLAQTVDHGTQQLRQTIGAEQGQLACLRALENGFVVRSFGGHLLQTL